MRRGQSIVDSLRELDHMVVGDVHELDVYRHEEFLRRPVLGYSRCTEHEKCCHQPDGQGMSERKWWWSWRICNFAPEGTRIGRAGSIAGEVGAEKGPCVGLVMPGEEAAEPPASPTDRSSIHSTYRPRVYFLLQHPLPLSLSSLLLIPLPRRPHPASHTVQHPP